MSAKRETQEALASLERRLRNHSDAEVRNLERLRLQPHPHTAAMCRVLAAMHTGPRGYYNVIPLLKAREPSQLLQ